MKKLVKNLVIILIWLGIWQLISMFTGLELLLASPVAVLKAFCRLLKTKSFYIIILTSTYRILLGFMIGTCAGIITGCISGKSDMFSSFIKPVIQLMKSLPIAVFIILLLMWFGSKWISTIISAIIVIPLIHFAVMDGIKSTPVKFLEMAQVYRVTGLRKIRYIYFSNIYSRFYSQCKTTVGMCFKAGVSAEVIGLASGTIGSQLYYSKLYLTSDELMCWGISVMLVSFLCEKLVLLLLGNLNRKIVK